jgi:O-Antigen ligase
LAAAPTARAWPFPVAARAARDRRVIAWVGVAAGIEIGLVGFAENSKPMIVASGLGVVALLAVLAPQFLLATFLVAGGLKEEPYLTGFPIDLTVLTAAGVILAMARRSLDREGLPRLPPATVLAAALAALVVMSVLWSPVPELGLSKALRFETFTMAAFFAPLVLVRSRAELIRLMVFVVGFSLLIALTAVPGTEPSEPLTLAGGHSEIELALYASFGTVASIYLAMATGSRWRILWLVPAAALAKFVIAAGSRGVLLGAIAAAVFIAVQAIRRARTKAVPIAMVAAVIAIVAAFGTQLAGSAAQKYQGFLFTGDTATRLGKRNFLLDDGVALAISHPLGLGASGYQAATQFIYPHNALVEAADEQGVVGAALLATLMLAALGSTLRRRGARVSAESVLAGGLLIVLISDAMVSQSFTQFRELWFAMGLALALPRLAQADT